MTKLNGRDLHLCDLEAVDVRGGAGGETVKRVTIKLYVEEMDFSPQSHITS